MEQFENKVINLVESRGVANGSYKNQKILDKMFSDIQVMLRENYDVKKEQYSFTQYYSLQWLESLLLKVNITNFPSKQEMGNRYGTGGYQPKSNQKILNNKKLNQGIIILNIYSINGILDKRSFNINLYHELNHCYDDYKRILNNKGNLYNLPSSINQENIMSGVRSRDKDIKYFCYLNYTLFIPTEFNALISSVYINLKTINSTSYKEDISKTQAYMVYRLEKNIIIPHLKSLPIKEWIKFQSYITKPFPQNINDWKLFKNKFIQKAEWKLNELFKRMGRTASLWYEEMDSQVKQENVKYGLEIETNFLFK